MGANNRPTRTKVKRPKFSKEQLTWLREALRPECCHVSGEHNPTHFEDQPKRVCYIQKYKAYDHVMKALKFAIKRGVSAPDCGWCPRKR